MQRFFKRCIFYTKNFVSIEKSDTFANVKTKYYDKVNQIQKLFQFQGLQGGT